MEIIHQLREDYRIVFTYRDDNSVLIEIEYLDEIEGKWLAEWGATGIISLQLDMIDPIIHNLQRIQKLSLLK